MNAAIGVNADKIESDERWGILIGRCAGDRLGGLADSVFDSPQLGHQCRISKELTPVENEQS
jgi:hypothetical protein